METIPDERVKMMVVRDLADIVNTDVTESGIIVYSKDTTINNIRRRIPIW